MKKLEIIIKKAQSRLKNQPIDSIHDIEHHRNVVVNCQKIIDEEGLNINSTNVIIAAWWHDVETQQGETTLLQREMKKLGFRQDVITSVSDIIHTHTYGEQPQTVEARILFDADKMEYFNPERMRKALKEANSSLLPVPILKQHHQEWLDRHKKILESFNFETSRKMAAQNFSATFAEIEKIARFLQSTE